VLKLTECASLFVANGLLVPTIAYKLHSPSDLICGLIRSQLKKTGYSLETDYPKDWFTVNFPI